MNMHTEILWNEIEKKIYSAFENRDPARDFWGVTIKPEHVALYVSSQKLRFKYVTQVVNLLMPKRGRVLEVGAAYGAILLALKQMGFFVEGTDMAEGIEAYTLPLSREGVAVHAWDIHREECPVAEGTFDAVIASEVLEHLQVSLKSAVKKLTRPLRPGGLLIVTTPNIYRLNNVASILSDRNLCERFPDQVALRENVIVDNRCHPREPTKRELTEAFRANDLDDISSNYFNYQPTSIKRSAISKIIPRLRDACIVVGRRRIQPQFNLIHESSDKL